MFIKFDELELLEFFENEPAIIGEYEEGNWLYSFQMNHFKIVLLMATYEMYVEVSINYKDNIVYSQKFDDIAEIKRANTNLKLITSGENVVIIKKEPQVGVIVE